MIFRFLAIEVGSKNGTKFNQQLHQKLEASWHRFFEDFGTILGRFWRSKSMKNRCQEASKTHHFFGRFWYRFLMLFGCVLVANLPPTWDPRRAVMGPGAARRRPKSRKNGAPKPRRSRERFGCDFGWILGAIWEDFQLILDRFLLDV